MTQVLSEKKIGDVSVLRLTFGGLSFDQQDQLEKELNKLIDSEQKNFIIDLSKAGFFSSLVMAAILSFAKDVWKKEGEIKLSGLSGETLSILQLTHLDKVFKVFDTEQDALEDFTKS